MEIRGEEAEGDYAEHARHDGDALTCQGLEEDADYGAKQRRAGVDVFYEDIGRVAGQHVAQDAAAHAGHYADEDEQERPVLSRLQRRADARHGEGPEAEAVHHQHCKVIKLVPSLEPAAAGHDENRYRRRHGEAGVYGVLEGPRRRAAEDEVADDAAAHGCRQAQYGHAEDVHVLAYARHRARGREGQGADELQHKDERIQA